MVNGNFLGKQLCHSHFAFSMKVNFLRKEFALLRINSFFKVKPHFEWAAFSRKANRKSHKLFPIL